MDQVLLETKVIYQEPFWHVFIERTEDHKLSVCKVTFGAEPKDYEVYAFFLKHYYELQFSPPVESVVKKVHLNPKRVQREVHRQVENTGIGKKSWLALKLQHEQMKTERKIIGKAQKEAEL